MNLYIHTMEFIDHTSLNADVMGIVLDCLDTTSLAKLAQTSRAWRSVVYRTNVWQTWKPKPRAIEYFYSDASIPNDAHHNGEPTRLCFLSWAAHKVRDNIFYDVPRSITSIEKADAFVDALYVFWASHGKPCVHTNHHKWSHVFKGSAQLKHLAKSEVERIGYRTTEFPTSSTTNPYRFWLMEYINSVPPIRIGALPPVRHEDTLVTLYNTIKRSEYEKMAEIGRRQEACIAKIEQSIRALNSHSAREFTENERLFRKSYGEMLSAITFALPQDLLVPPLPPSESSESAARLAIPDTCSPS